jgi:uncharacterized protein YndB with AHSA1/START domain
MQRIERRVVADKPIDRVFAYLADFTTTEEWDPGTVRCERVSGDGGVGTTYRNVSRFLGRETELEYVVQEYEPDRRIQLRGANKSVDATDTITMRPDGAGTEIVYVAEFEFSGIAKYAAPLLAPALKKLGDDAEKGMRRALSRL